MEKKIVIALFLIFTTVFLLYRLIFGVYFTGDDFFHFQVAQTDGSLKEFVNFFGFHPFEERKIAFYRPIFREVLYNGFYSLFGLNHLPFRTLALIIHFINITLVYLLMQKLFNKKLLSLFTAFFFGVTAANVGVLYYLAGGIQGQGATMFLLLTLLLFWKYLRNNVSKYKYFSFLFFVAALASHEQAIVALPLLFGLIFIQSKRNFKELLPLVFIVGIYLYLNFFKIGFSENEAQYQLILNPKRALNTLAWYSGWGLGLPEMLIDFVRPGLSLNPSLMKYWGDYFRIIFPTFFISIGFLGLTSFYLFFKRRKIFRNYKLWFLIIWFPLALAPVLFLPWHKSTYYLAPALPAFWGIIGYLVYSAYDTLKNKLPAKILFFALFFSLFTLSIFSIKLGDSTYWAASRGRLSKKLINQVKSKYPELPKGAVVYFEDDPEYPFVAEDWGGTSKQASFALSGSDALQLLYEDPTLKVFYEDIGDLPENISEDQIFSLTATFLD